MDIPKPYARFVGRLGSYPSMILDSKEDIMGVLDLPPDVMWLENVRHSLSPEEVERQYQSEEALRHALHPIAKAAGKPGPYRPQTREEFEEALNARARAEAEHPGFYSTRDRISQHVRINFRPLVSGYNRYTRRISLLKAEEAISPSFSMTLTFSGHRFAADQVKVRELYARSMEAGAKVYWWADERLKGKLKAYESPYNGKFGEVLNVPVDMIPESTIIHGLTVVQEERAGWRKKEQTGSWRVSGGEKYEYLSIETERPDCRLVPIQAELCELFGVVPKEEADTRLLGRYVDQMHLLGAVGDAIGKKQKSRPRRWLPWARK